MTDWGAAAWAGSSEQVLWYLPDHLGSVLGIVDSGGELVDTLRYDAFGVLTAESNPSGGEGVVRGREGYLGLLPRYAGYEWDSALGLYHVGARWYDPFQGRWLSRDPLGLAADSNPYRYVSNTPTNAVDPSGLFSLGDASIHIILFQAGCCVRVRVRFRRLPMYWVLPFT